MARDETECPIPGCENTHSRKLLMCPLHWWRLPKDVQNEVYRALRQNGVLSDEYLHARQIAIDTATNAA